MRATKSPCVGCTHQDKAKAKQPCKDCGESGRLAAFRAILDGSGLDPSIRGSSLTRVDEGAQRRNGNYISL